MFPGISTFSNAWNLLWKCFFGKEQPLQQKLVDVQIVIKIKREIIILSVVRGKKADSPCCCFATAYGVTVQHVSTCVFFYGDIRTRTCKKVCVTCIDKHLQHFSFYSQEELLVIVISIILLIGQKRTCYGPKEQIFNERQRKGNIQTQDSEETWGEFSALSLWCWSSASNPSQSHHTFYELLLDSFRQSGMCLPPMLCTIPVLLTWERQLFYFKKNVF